MSAVASSELHTRPAVRFSERAKLALWIVIATGLALLMAAPTIRSVLHGGFGDPDDAMRLVEVRAFMAGQPWFDVTAMRLDPPAGASMHWSRLVDLPNAALISLFALVTDQAHAEAFDRIAFPTILLAALFAGMARLATVLVGRGAVPAALLGTLLSGATLVQFAPGRIGHHAPETVTLVFAVTLALESLDKRYARRAIGAGALAALAMAMSFETLPLLAALCAALVLLWVVRGAPTAPTLGCFALGLGPMAAALFLATVPPARWLAPTCDAFGMAHLGATLIFAAGTFALSRASHRLPQAWIRMAGVALTALAYIAICFPGCLKSPFAGVDPLVRSVWLDNVVESKSLADFARKLPMTGLAILLPTVLGLLGLLSALRGCKDLQAQRFAILAGLVAVGLICALHQVRVFASVGPLALCGGLVAAAALREKLAARGTPVLAATAALAVLPFASTAWALMLPLDAAPAGHAGAACLSPKALAPLASLAPGRVVAPMDVGSHILEATPHAVFAAPYHRNNDGNRFTFDVFLAPPAEAKARLASRGVSYVVTCDGMGETARLAALAPQGLAAALIAGRIPDYLKPVGLSGTPYRVFTVDPAR